MPDSYENWVSIKSECYCKRFVILTRSVDVPGSSENWVSSLGLKRTACTLKSCDRIKRPFAYAYSLKVNLSKKNILLSDVFHYLCKSFKR